MRNKFYEVVWAVIRPVVLLFYPLDVKGLENLPEEPVVLCANHSSNWDPILMILAMSQKIKLRIMAKEQLFRIPVVNAVIRKMGAFPVNRGHSDIGAVRTSIQSLKAGFHLLIFPEGTRVRQPGKVSVKGGAAMIAIRSGVKMLPVFIGTTKRLFRRVPVIFGKPYTPVYSGRKGTAEEYQANAEEIMRQAYELGGIS